MKKLLLTLTATLACVAAFAQGKLAFTQDATHLVYYDATAGSLAGSPVSSANMPAGVNLVADLYGGSSAGVLTLVSTTTFGATKGRWTAANMVFNVPPLPGGTVAFFRIDIRDGAFPTAAAALAAGSYGGSSPVFSAVPQVSIANPIYQPTAPVNSTWASGTFNMDAQVAVGSRGAIAVGIVPEPSSFALAGLGAAALFIFRRRK